MANQNPFPIDKEVINQLCRELNISSLSTCTIRQIVQLVNQLQKKYDVEFIRTEMGVPGLNAPQAAIRAETEALQNGVSSIYPPIEGIPALKEELAKFAKLFIDINISEKSCIPTVGSMQSSFVTFMVGNRRERYKDTTLFIDPGFPVHKRQIAIQGMKYQNFDIYDYRGDKLRDKLESYLRTGSISTILYSNPNNPAWICLTEKELKIIGELATKYDVIVMEDMAYFGMDFRQDYGKPGIPPYQPTVARYTENYVLLFSSSKIFSYAGQRIGSLLISDQLFHRRYPELLKTFNTDEFGPAILQDAMYATTAGTAHSPQAALAEMLRQINEGEYDFVKVLREYEQRASVMKKLFVEKGFQLVYDHDEENELADGFYFTISYPGLSGEELLEKLIRNGISAITLDTTGSSRSEGLRICVSHTAMNRMDELKKRLETVNSYQ
jgi:aspartate/methionine/tyrosine aminotransferase